MQTPKKIQLVDDWKSSWRFISVQLAGILAILDLAYPHLPLLQQYLPENWVSGIAIAIVIGRVIKQKADQESGVTEESAEKAE